MAKKTTSTLTIRIYKTEGNPSHIFTGLPKFDGMTLIDALLLADAMSMEQIFFGITLSTGLGSFIISVDSKRNTDLHAWSIYINNKKYRKSISNSLETINDGIMIDLKFEKIDPLSNYWQYSKIVSV